MILNYKNFIEESLLENINESLIYYAPPLRKILGKLPDNEIAKSLVSIEGDDVKPDVTFINLDDEGYLSFTTMRNAKNSLAINYKNSVSSLDTTNTSLADTIYSTDNTEIYSKSRSKIKIGKLINKLFPGKYSASEIEGFVNSFKSIVENTAEKFKLVSGDDINYWYWYENYKVTSGTLGSSCMARKKDLFGVYVNNPEVCQMLVLTEEDKLIGRALIWKFTSLKKYGDASVDCEYFMDRQYTIKDSDVIKFRNYAKEKGWAYKANNNHHSLEPVIYNGDEFNANITVQLKKEPGRKSDFKYSKYPYMDTLRRYNIESGILDNIVEREDDTILLEDTGGGYSNNSDEGSVYSEYYDRNIDEDDAVYSDPIGDYIIADRSVLVEHGSRSNMGYYPDDHDDIRYDEWSDIYINMDDAVFSEEYDYYLLSENAISVIYEIDDDGKPNSETYYIHKDDDDFTLLSEFKDKLWYSKLSSKYSNWGYGSPHDAVKNDLLEHNDDDELIPSQFSIKTYLVESENESDEDLYGVKYLSEVDSKILNVEITDEEILTDKWTYDSEIDVLKDKLIENSNILVKNILKEMSEIEDNLVKPNDIDYDKKLKYQEDKSKISVLNTRRFYFEERRDELTDGTYN